MPQDLPLEPDLIKVLASDTRRDILRHLQDRNMTVTELARELELGKATVHEHLNKLTQAGLTERREDDRLWVYYQLTGEGKRMLNPQRTRFYLIVAVSALAGIVALLALALFLSTAGGPDDGFSSSGASDALSVQPGQEQVYSAGAFQLDALVQGAEPGEVRAYLLTPEDAERLRTSGQPVEGIALQVEPTSQTAAMQEAADSAAEASDGEPGAPGPAEQGPSSLVLRSQAPLPAGTYLLYVVSLDGSDNVQRMPTIQVQRMEGTVDPAIWYQGIDGPVNVSVSSSGAPVTGTLVVEPAAPGDGDPLALRLDLENGTATLAPGSLDRLNPGRYDLRVLPQGAQAWQPLEQQLTLHRPQLVLERSHLLATDTAHVGAGLAPAGAPNLSALELHANGTFVTHVEDAGERTRLTLADLHPGPITLHVGRGITTTAQAHPALTAEITLRDGPTWELRLGHTNGTPVAGYPVSLDGSVVGLTSSQGNVTLDFTQGPHRLGVGAPEGPALQIPLQVDGWNVHAAYGRPLVVPMGIQTRGGEADLHVRVHNQEPATALVSLTALRDGRAYASAPLTVPADGNATATLTVPLHGEDEEAFTVRAERFAHPTVAFHNRTSQADEREPGGASAPPEGGDGTDDAGGAETTLAAAPGDSAVMTVRAPLADEAAQAAEQIAQGQAPDRQRIGPSEGLAADQSAETPGPAGALVLVAVATAALAHLVVARARRRR